MPPRAGRCAIVVLTVLCVALTACGGGSGGGEDDGPFAGLEVEPFPKPDIVLTDTSGAPFDLRAETEGRLTLLYFAYTTCPDICPVHLAQLDSVLDRPEMPDNVSVVVVTVDPERDTPEVLRDYLDHFSDEFIGLRGTVEEVEEAQRATPTIAVAFKVPDDDIGYTMAHAGQVVAFAPDGMAYAVYGERTRQSHWANDLPLLAAIES